MVLKQALTKTCRCGALMMFPEGEVKTTCIICSAVWELGLEGFWGIRTVVFAPILAKIEKRRLNHYERYMAWRDFIRGKKGGSKMLKKIAKSVRKVLRDCRTNEVDTQTIVSKEELLVDYLDTRNVGQRGISPNFIRPFGMRRGKF